MLLALAKPRFSALRIKWTCGYFFYKVRCTIGRCVINHNGFKCKRRISSTDCRHSSRYSFAFQLTMIFERLIIGWYQTGNLKLSGFSERYPWVVFAWSVLDNLFFNSARFSRSVMILLMISSAVNFSGVCHHVCCPNGIKYTYEFTAVGKHQPWVSLRKGGNACVHARTDKKVTKTDDAFDRILIVLFHDHMDPILICAVQICQNAAAGIRIGVYVAGRSGKCAGPAGCVCLCLLEAVKPAPLQRLYNRIQPKTCCPRCIRRCTINH